MSNVAIIGTGYVGLVTGACLSEFGINVICVDIDQKKVCGLNNGIIPIYEPELDTIVKKNSRSGRLKFTTDLAEAVAVSEIIFIAVGTPPKEDGSADLQYVKSAAVDIAKHMNEYKVIVNKSTVPVGTAKLVKSLILSELSASGRNIEFSVVSNPEFLREGAAVRDFMHPDRVVIGSDSEKATDMMKKIYNSLYLIQVPFIITTPETAELIKYASNAFLAAKISFINEISLLCEKIGADVHDVAKSMGLDGRIGSKFLHAGPGYGGSCLPKDTEALLQIGETYGIEMKMVRAAVEVNNRQTKFMAAKVENGLGCLKEKTIAVLGLSFKPETDDVRKSPAIEIIKDLLSKGAYIKAFDPAAMKNANKHALSDENITYCHDEYDCAKDCDALIIATEWNQFRNLDLLRIKSLMKQPYFFDLRNVYEPEDMKALGFFYEGVGRR